MRTSSNSEAVQIPRFAPAIPTAFRGTLPSARVRRPFRGIGATLVAAVLWSLPVMPSVWAQYAGNFQTNTFDGVAASTNWGGIYFVGSNLNNDVLWVLNGAGLTNTAGAVGYGGTSGRTNLAVVSGDGSLWTNSGDLNVGYNLPANRLVISNGGRAVSANAYLGYNASGANDNQILVASGGVFLVTGNTFVGRSGGATRNQLIVTNGGRVQTSVTQVGANGADNGLVLVSGAGSVWTNASTLTLGNGTAAADNNRVIINEGGFAYAGSTVNVGNTAGAEGNSLTIRGTGSTFSAGGLLAVGSNANGKGRGWVLVTDGGILEIGVSGMRAGSNDVSTVPTGVISNSGGIFQFTLGTPIITPQSYGNIVVTDGTISFRGATNANVWGSYGSNQLGNILYQGANTFRLNSASNTYAASPQDYAFDGSSPSNYVGLEMINGGTAWQSAWLKIGTGRTMLVSNTAATVDGVMTNLGTITVANGSVAWRSNVVLAAGNYVSRNGSNTFGGGITVESAVDFTIGLDSTLQVGGLFLNRGTATFSNLYTVAGGSGYQSQGGADRFMGGLQVASGGRFEVTNGVSTVSGVITNSGTMSVVNGRAVYQGPVVLTGGAYYSDPSTNTFNSSFTVDASSVVTNAPGDVYAFGTDFNMLSTNRAFNMSSAKVVFTDSNLALGVTSGLTNHTLNLSGSGALDKGSNWLNAAQLSTNFSIGSLTIALDNRLTLLGDKASRTNALYVGILDLSAWNTNAGSLNATLLAALDLNVNLYYEAYAAENAYLGAVAYDLWGGNGLLIPIPEPSVMLAAGAGLVLFLFFRRKTA